MDKQSSLLGLLSVQENSFVTLNPFSLSFSSLTQQCNKLVCLTLANFPVKLLQFRYSLASLKKLAKDKRSSLFNRGVSDE